VCIFRDKSFDYCIVDNNIIMTEQKKKKRRMDPIALNSEGADRIRIFRENKKVDEYTILTNDLREDSLAIGDYFNRVGAIDSRLNWANGVQLDPIETERANQAKKVLFSLKDKMASFMARVWNRHTFLHDTHVRSSPQHYIDALRISWIIVCRSHLLILYINDMLKEKRGFDLWPSILFNIPSSYSYVLHMYEHRRPIHFDDESIGTLSVASLMNMAQLLFEALDMYGWTYSAGDYLDALFARYTMFIAYPGTEISDDPIDMGKFAANENDYATPLLSPAPVTNALLDVGESLFFNHIWHNRSIQHFWSSSTQPARSLQQEEQLELEVACQHRRLVWLRDVGISAFKTHLLTVATRGFLVDTIINDMKFFYPERLLWPGEYEKLHFDESKRQSPTPMETLLELRVDHFKRAQALLQLKAPLDIPTILKEFITSEEVVVEQLLEQMNMPPEERTLHPLEDVALRHRIGPDHERFVLLLFERIFERTCLTWECPSSVSIVENIYADCRASDLKKFARNRPVPDCTTARQYFRQMNSTWPFLTCVWYSYALLANGDQYTRPFTTPILVEALCLWLGIIYAQREKFLDVPAFWTSGWKTLAMPRDCIPPFLLNA
jgi:hypothetical protein